MITFDKLNLNKDYQDLCELWKKRNLDCLAFENCSDFGSVAKQNNKVVGVFFIYLTLNTPIYLIRFPVVDDSLSSEEKDEVVNGLISTTETIAKELGYKHALCTTNHRGLIKRLKSLDYKCEFENCVHLTKEI